MGCAQGQTYEKSDVQPRAVARPPEHGGGGIIELSVEEGSSELTLPDGCSEEAVPPLLVQYLTFPAWMAICTEMKEQQWHHSNGATGHPIAAGLTSSYAPLTFKYYMHMYVIEVQGGNDENGNPSYHSEKRYVFKLSIDTLCIAKVAIPEDTRPGQTIQFTHPVTQQLMQVTAPVDGAKTMEVAASVSPPAQPMTARSMIVEVPAGSALGAEIEVEHPETKVKYRVRPPVPMAPGGQFRSRL
jgi:hypothetical protein